MALPDTSIPGWIHKNFQNEIVEEKEEEEELSEEEKLKLEIFWRELRKFDGVG
jgi:hypothetical protein